MRSARHAPNPSVRIETLGLQGAALMTVHDDEPLSIAYLTYRGKPHVGGQGVYTRHLTKALVDLGHHVEVLGGQPYPILDDARAAARAAQPRHLQRLLPDADAGPVGAQDARRLGRGHRVLVRHLPRAAGVQRAGRPAPARAGSTTSTWCRTTSASATACSAMERHGPARCWPPSTTRSPSTAASRWSTPRPPGSASPRPAGTPSPRCRPASPAA